MWSTACALVDWGKLWYDEKRKRGRVVEGARLEIVWAGDRLGGSNPLASANYAFLVRMRFFVYKVTAAIRIRTYGANPLASARFVNC